LSLVLPVTASATLSTAFLTEPLAWSTQTWRRIATELGRLHLVTLTGPTGTIAQTTELTDTQRELYAATGVQPPPRITALQPA
jgi:hypothetical protein